jgi:hypothetical protein
MTDQEQRRRRLAAVRAIAPLHDDAETGMAWWNNLSDRERKRWMQRAGNTGRAADAWEAFKRGDTEDLPAVSSGHYSP